MAEGYDAVIRHSLRATSRRSAMIVFAFIHGQDRGLLRRRIKLKEILQNLIAIEPFTANKLIGDLKGFYSARLSYKDRIVYSIDNT
ncbi:hypothetical protein ACFL1Z_09410 [Thermodesulfobacteriota bacterium]